MAELTRFLRTCCFVENGDVDVQEIRASSVEDKRVTLHGNEVNINNPNSLHAAPVEYNSISLESRDANTTPDGASFHSTYSNHSLGSASSLDNGPVISPIVKLIRRVSQSVPMQTMNLLASQMVNRNDAHQIKDRDSGLHSKSNRIGDFSRHLACSPENSRAVASSSQSRSAGWKTLTQVAPDAEPSPSTWKTLTGTEFLVRTGPNYKKNKKKAHSVENMYDTIGMDILKDGDLITNIAPKLPLDNVDFPTLPADCGVPHMIILNVQMIPEGGGWTSSAPKSFVSVFFYAVLRPEYAALVNTDKEPAQLRLLREMSKRRESTRDLAFKTILAVVDIEKTSLPSVVAKQNGKPFLITKSANILTGTMAHPQNPTYWELDVDQQAWGYIARHVTASARRMTPSLSINMGFLIEATQDKDLPEQLLSSAALQLFDISDSVALFETTGGSQMNHLRT